MTILSVILVGTIGLTPVVQPATVESKPIQGTVPWGDWNHYHNYMEIVNTLRYLNETYPDIVDVFPIGKSWQNRTIYCIRLTNEKIQKTKPEVFFVGYHHARELISAELPLYFAVEATTRYDINATVTYILDNSEIYIVVATNVDGFDVVKQNSWQRKNAHPYDDDGDGLLDEDPPNDENGDGYVEWLWRSSVPAFMEGVNEDGDSMANEDWIGGVDLNRNYGYKWDAPAISSSSDPSSEVYIGPAPFSEPETQAIRDLALQHNFKYALSFHSGSECIIYPWGYTTTPTLHEPIFKQIAGNLSALTGAIAVQAAQGLYTASGSWDDWMYGNRSTLALTCEIYANPNSFKLQTESSGLSRLRGVSQFYNPDPNDIEKVIQRWLPVFIYISNRAITKNVEFAQAVTTLKAEISPAVQGKPVILKAYLKDIYGNPVRGMKVDFQILGWPSWIQIGSAYTDSNGAVSISYTPTQIGTFQVRALFNGAAEYSQSTSEIAFLDVQRDFSLFITFGYISLAMGVTVGCPGAYAYYRKNKVRKQRQKDQYERFMSRWNAFLQVVEEEQSKRRAL